jgi:hypothetical protein
MKHIFSVTFDIVTEESAEDGEASKSGYVLESAPLDDAIRSVLTTECNTIDGQTIYANETNGRINWVTVSHAMNWITGEYETRHLHIPKTVTAASTRRIAKLLGIEA